MANKPLAKAQPATLSTNIPLPEKPTARRDVRQIPNGEWVGGVMIDAQDTISESGMPMASYTFEVTSPRIYAGTKLFFTLHEKLDKSLDPKNPASLASQFPGVDLLNPDATWAAIGNGVPLRIHVGHRQVTSVETGEVTIAYRVTGFRLDEYARVK